MTTQYLRKWRLAVSDDAGNAYDLSELKIQFTVESAVVERPNTLAARVFNVADKTALRIADAKQSVRAILQAGYEGSFGTIFSGNIVQVRSGKIDATDTYVDIFAADGDRATNWGVTNMTLAAGYTQADITKAVGQAFQTYGVTVDPRSYGYIPSRAPRGRVLYGLAREQARIVAQTSNLDWSIQQGQVLFLPQTAVLPGDAVVLTSATGLIGRAQQTQDGITARCLLNPSLGSGVRVHIDNASIEKARYNLSELAINNFPSIARDGFYKILWVDHVGDNYGTPWYTDFTCVALDATIQPITNSVIRRAIPSPPS